MKQTITMTFFSYAGMNKVWAMMQMRDGKKKMRKEPGIIFVRLLGSGGGAGYSLSPDFGTYALLCVWKDESDAEHFFSHSSFYTTFKSHSREQFTIYMRNISTRGSWSDESPFIPAERDQQNPFISVLTRATLKNSYLFQFWKRVPNVSKTQETATGLIFSKGVGEIPFFEQATFTIWENEENMIAFAYQSKYHTEAIKKTRELKGFKEEMFSRFQPYKTTGSWKGKKINSLSDLLKQ
jgi:heme-degrading monooxygenase HmoA